MNVVFGGQIDEPRQLGGHGHDDDAFVRQAVGAAGHQQPRHVQLQIWQQGPRRQFLHRQRRENGQDLAGEVRLQKLPLRVGPLLAPPDVKAVFRQERQDLAHAGGLLIDHAVNAAANGGELLGGGHAGNVAPPDVGRPGAHQPRHPHQKELVEVRVDDGQELQPLQQRQLRGQSFLQHAVVEFQPAQLAIEIKIGRFKRVLGHAIPYATPVS